jgi:hypothetical protein
MSFVNLSKDRSKRKTKNNFINLNNDNEDNSVSIPAGYIKFFSEDELTDGWIFCDGSSLSRAVYKDLFLSIGTNFGNCDNDSFNIPDFRNILSNNIGKGFFIKY